MGLKAKVNRLEHKRREELLHCYWCAGLGPYSFVLRRAHEEPPPSEAVPCPVCGRPPVTIGFFFGHTFGAGERFNPASTIGSGK